MHVGYTEAHGGIPDLGVLGDVHEITTGREFAAAGEAVTVHLRDHRLREIPDRHPALGDVPRPVAFALRREPRLLLPHVAAPEVVSGGERRAGTAHDRHPHVVVTV